MNRAQSGPKPILPVLLIAIVGGVLMITAQTVIVAQLDSMCYQTLGENVTALEDQPLFDQQLDCQYPNGTVVYDVDPKPMNFTSQEVIGPHEAGPWWSVGAMPLVLAVLVSAALGVLLGSAKIVRRRLG